MRFGLMAGVMVAASVLTAAEIPFNALRFGWAATSEENWPGMRQALAANPSAFDEVWMSSGTGFPPLDWHVGQARRCAAAASDLRKMGIVPSVEIQTVIGHSDRFLSAQDCRGRTWSTWVGYDGAVAANIACRGVPVVSGRCRSLGVLPDLHQLPVKSPDPTPDTAPGWQTRTMQTATTGALLDYYRLCDKACGGKLPVVFEYPVMAMAVPHVRPDGTLATLAVVNASIDRQEPVAVRLRGVPEGARSAKWHEPEKKPVEIPLTRVGGGVKAVLPRLGAWSGGCLSF